MFRSSDPRPGSWPSRSIRQRPEGSPLVHLPFTAAAEAGHEPFVGSLSGSHRAHPLHTRIPEGNTVKITRFGAIGAIALAGAFALSSCAANEPTDGGDSPSTLSGTLVGAGSSAQGSAQEAW